MAPTWPQHSSQGQHRPYIGQHERNIGPTWAQDVPNIAQHRPNLGQYRPKMGPTWLNMGPTWPNISPRWVQGPTWPNMGTTCAQHRPRLLPYRPALRIMPASVLNIALPRFARRISAQSSHTISQKSLLGRRPAVRRKPLNICTYIIVWCISTTMPLPIWQFQAFDRPPQLWQPEEWHHGHVAPSKMGDGSHSKENVGKNVYRKLWGNIEKLEKIWYEKIWYGKIWENVLQKIKEHIAKILQVRTPRNTRGFEDRTHPCKWVFQKFLVGLVWKTRGLVWKTRTCEPQGAFMAKGMSRTQKMHEAVHLAK